MKKVIITISGDVQGIFFRAFVKDRANELGLTGYVRNTEDKKVEAVVEGHELKINKLIESCKEGPMGAKVNNVMTKTIPCTGEFKNFRIKY
ncbi:acylphosphatase [Candidatus Woesearchaeota archaeon]|nr:acylphosphatase [Candidatus Woesearchaeota archaeon]